MTTKVPIPRCKLVDSNGVIDPHWYRYFAQFERKFDENAQDAVGEILTDTATIDFTYADATPSITADVKADSITNSLLANMAQTTLKGRAVGAGTGDPTDLTATQAKAILVTVGEALSKTDDTNVTMTLGGAPTTALLSAASMTLGWTGVLAVSRGGTGGSVASGTLLDNITGFASTGMMARTGAGTYAFRTITGTAAEITVTSGDGSGNPTLSLPTALTFTGKTVTGGTFTNLTSLGAGNSDFVDPIAGTAKMKLVDGTQVLTFRDNSVGEGYVCVSNGTVKVLIGQTHDLQGGVIGTFSNHTLVFRTNNSGRMQIDTSGNVGIAAYGTSAPAALVNKLFVDGDIKTKVYTVATLPAAATAGAGARAFVSDANATTFASVVAGGGANNVPVYCDATNWLIG